MSTSAKTVSEYDAIAETDQRSSKAASPAAAPT